ncbi:MAG TPA: MMPL family transporter [Solirubrobacterales bacterium]|nr:MMPL family transporter [Solirubrobacterales bacterium]
MSSLAAWAVRHARAVLALALLLALAAAVAATQLPTDAATDTLVDPDTPGYRATEEVRREFGEEPVVVLARGDLQQLILTANLGRLLRLEGCLSGRVPKGAKALPGPCSELAEREPVRSVIGPATFLNEVVIQIDRQLQRLSKTLSPDELRELLIQLAARYGITSVPSIGNPDFIASVVFDLEGPRGTPKSRLAYLFPNGESAQIILRLKPGLSEAERHEAIETIRAVVRDPVERKACKFKGEPERCFELNGGSYVISGVPVVVDAVTRALAERLFVLLAVALVVMAAALMLVFRSRWRLLPLALALGAAALTFGLFGLAGGSLTMASIAVLPILIGLAVDYAIQLQARYDEAVALGASPGVDAARFAASGGAPAIATACLATGAGFLALQLSPTPMVRSFGLLLVVGVAIAFTLAFVVGFASLSLRPERAGGGGVPESRGVLFFARFSFSDGRNLFRRKTQRAEGHPLLLPLLQRILAVAESRPERVLVVGLGLAVIGWGVGTQIETQTDIRKLAPQGVEAVQELNELQDVTGVSGELDARITAPDLTDPATIRWMAGFKRRALKAGGFSGANPSCQEAEVCPGPALSDFVTGGGLTGPVSGPLTQKSIRATLKQLPAYDLRQVATVDPETGLPDGTALIGFGIRAQSLEDQQELIERMRDAVGEPPPGVEVELAGLPVIAAAAASDLSDSRYLLTLVGLLAVALVLLVVYRSWRRALVPLAPIVMATGWSALVLFATRVPLNPMSAALGALTIAIATEFSVILAARFRQERHAGRELGAALRQAYTRTGAAVLASGVTAIAGFAVLIASDVRMLRDFGFVTVIDLAVALLGVLIALPAALVLAERWGQSER